MRNIKKILALMCVASLGTAMFAGCTKVSDVPQNSDETQAAEAGEETATDGSEKVLNVAVFQGGYGREVWDTLAERFEEEHEGVTVNVTANPKLGDVIRPQIMSGNPPDVIFLSATNESGVLQSLIQDKALECLDDVFDDEMKAKFVPGSLDAPTISPYGDGKIYAAPLFYSTMGLFYNKTLFAENNLEVPKTWDDFFELGDKAKEMGIGLFTYAAANDPSYNEIVFNPAIASAGGPELLEDCFNYKEGAWTSEPVKKVMGVYQKIADGGYLLDGTLAMTHTQSQEQFLQNKSLFIPNGNWLENEMKDTPRADGFAYGFTGIPVFEEGDTPCVWSNIEEIYVPSAAKEIDLAKEFIKFLYTDDSIMTLAESTGAIPPIEGAADLTKSVLSDSVYETYAITEKGYTPVTGGFAMTEQSEISIRDDIYNTLNSIMAGEKNVDEWSELIESDSNKLSEIVLK
ncbi:MAG: carbohydrate ABC transporter substrate-binding protein [Pseudobutyrivibrio sp.]|nr:carbohydrate ABC transporter substrate-binding protein [Pseudobutyrivibrio sp.]